MKLLKLALVLCAGLTTVAAMAQGIGSATSGSSLPPRGATPAPLITENVGQYKGEWAVEGGRLIETFTEGGTRVSSGASAIHSVAADSVLSFGFVGGYSALEASIGYAQLSGQAGSEVTGIRVVSASGVTTSASLVDGVWAALWGGKGAEDDWGHPVTIQFDTPTGTHEISSDQVNTYTKTGQ